MRWAPLSNKQRTGVGRANQVPGNVLFNTEGFASYIEREEEEGEITRYGCRRGGKNAERLRSAEMVPVT